MGMLFGEKIDDEQRILNRMSGNRNSSWFRIFNHLKPRVTYYSNSSIHGTGAYNHEALDK